MSAVSKRLTATAAVIAMIGLGSAGCGSRAAPSSPQAPASSPRSVTLKPAPGTPSPSVAPTSSAARQLAGFFAAAKAADTQLHHAAVLVNDAIGTQAMHFTPATRAAVEAVDVARPPGRSRPECLSGCCGECCSSTATSIRGSLRSAA